MKYNEIMERIRVDEDMRARVLKEVAEATENADGTDKVTDLKTRLPLKRVLPVVAAACLLLIIGSAAVSGVFSGKGSSSAPAQSAAATVESAEEAAVESAADEAPAEAYAADADEPAAEEAAAEESPAGLTARAAASTEDSASGSKSADAAAAEENGTSEAAAEDTVTVAETTEEAAESEEAAVETAGENEEKAAPESAGGTSEAESQSAEGTADAGVSSSDAIGTATEAETLTHLSELAGFEVRELTDLPFDVASVTYTYLAGRGAQIVYAGEDGEEVVYTMSPEVLPAVDPSSYEDIMVIHSGGREIVLYGADKEYSLAVWEGDGYVYTLELVPARGQAIWRRIGFT